ncbi:unnamed protein product [Amoebophrya sp. A120]|nr:unnamed protein product [Amoebophrya sp. A120]|eukprot:GSA120T00015235001.1
MNPSSATDDVSAGVKLSQHWERKLRAAPLMMMVNVAEMVFADRFRSCRRNAFAGEMVMKRLATTDPFDMYNCRVDEPDCFWRVRASPEFNSFYSAWVQYAVGGACNYVGASLFFPTLAVREPERYFPARLASMGLLVYRMHMRKVKSAEWRRKMMQSVNKKTNVSDTIDNSTTTTTVLAPYGNKRYFQCRPASHCSDPDAPLGTAKAVTPYHTWMVYWEIQNARTSRHWGRRGTVSASTTTSTTSRPPSGSPFDVDVESEQDVAAEATSRSEVEMLVSPSRVKRPDPGLAMSWWYNTVGINFAIPVTGEFWRRAADRFLPDTGFLAALFRFFAFCTRADVDVDPAVIREEVRTRLVGSSRSLAVPARTTHVPKRDDMDDTVPGLEGQDLLRVGTRWSPLSLFERSTSRPLLGRRELSLAKTTRADEASSAPLLCYLNLCDASSIVEGAKQVLFASLAFKEELGREIWECAQDNEGYSLRSFFVFFRPEKDHMGMCSGGAEVEVDVHHCCREIYPAINNLRWQEHVSNPTLMRLPNVLHLDAQDAIWGGVPTSRVEADRYATLALVDLSTFMALLLVDQDERPGSAEPFQTAPHRPADGTLPTETSSPSTRGCAPAADVLVHAPDADHSYLKNDTTPVVTECWRKALRDTVQVFVRTDESGCGRYDDWTSWALPDKEMEVLSQQAPTFLKGSLLNNATSAGRSIQPGQQNDFSHNRRDPLFCSFQEWSEKNSLAFPARPGEGSLQLRMLMEVHARAFGDHSTTKSALTALDLSSKVVAFARDVTKKAWGVRVVLENALR